MKFICPHVSFILKSKSENCIKIRWFLRKLQTKTSWLLFMAHGVVMCLWAYIDILLSHTGRANKNRFHYTFHVCSVCCQEKRPRFCCISWKWCLTCCWCCVSFTPVTSRVQSAWTPCGVSLQQVATYQPTTVQLWLSAGIYLPQCTASGDCQQVASYHSAAVIVSR